MSDTEKNNDKKLQALKNMESIKELEEQAKRDVGGAPDQALLSHVLKESDSKNTSFFNPNREWDNTDKYRVALVITPSWGVLFPPYSLAKLSSLVRYYGYSVKCYDVNIESYHYFLKEHDQDYWKTERYFLWEYEDNFKQYFLPELIPILDNVVNDILESEVRVVGFSIFSTNLYATLYMVKRLRELKPDICILGGGPETITNIEYFQESGMAYDLFNYIFVGESEDNLIYTLENLPEQLPMNQVIGDIKSRLQLESYPYADYSDYDVRNYIQHGLNIETSRGCIAQCSFCAETFFWKFRGINPERVVDEIEYQVKKHKVQRIWFVDSLINGNLKNFEKIVDLIREKRLNIKWHSMARCDGRMDLIFLRKVIASGCTALSFGVECGSEKVLLDMKKKVEIWEIENNLRDTKKLGMFNHIHWQVGFPTEEPIDYLHSLQLLYNARKWIGNISPGFGTAIAKNTPLENNYKDYGIVGNATPYCYDMTFLNQWYTTDYKNTIIHRFLRVKMTHVWLEILKEHRGSIIMNTNEGMPIKNLYSIDFKKDKVIHEYLERDFNVNFNQFNNGTLSNSLANEYLSLCYVIYLYFNKATFTFKCDPDEDLKVFGNFIVRKYSSNIFFNIKKGGDYTLIIDHEFSHTTDEDHLKSKYEEERKVKDQSFKERLEKSGNISDWQTKDPIVRETIHKQYKKS